jgi:hypothetical protein
MYRKDHSKRRAVLLPNFGIDSDAAESVVQLSRKRSYIFAHNDGIIDPIQRKSVAEKKSKQILIILIIEFLFKSSQRHMRHRTQEVNGIR